MKKYQVILGTVVHGKQQVAADDKKPFIELDPATGQRLTERGVVKPAAESAAPEKRPAKKTEDDGAAAAAGKPPANAQ